ncbi:hypothetical protein ACHAXR_013476 [Thalassiosira sp. AJA248-18]
MSNEDETRSLSGNAAFSESRGKRIRSDSITEDEENRKPPAMPGIRGESSATLPLLEGDSSATDASKSETLKQGSDFSQQLEVLLESLPPSDKHKFIAADSRRKEDDRKIIAAHYHLVDARSEFHRAQSKLEQAQTAYDKAKSLSQEHSEQDADNLLLEPTEWNSRYTQLKAYFDREGHSHIKRNITDTDVEFMSETEAAEFRALSRWTCRQRKFKRSGELEHYKALLLNRLNFDWDPKTGHGPEKWHTRYNLLKDFKQIYGHVEISEVALLFIFHTLGLWVKTQLTLYRNGKEGKLPALSPERIRMLEEIGIAWGERRKGIPWGDRFQALLDYKKRFGHVHVPWQWKENVGLAQWVNTQRKKYKDLKDGKKNNLSEAQINMLNSVGFKWCTSGKGRYSDDAQAKLGTHNAASINSADEVSDTAFSKSHSSRTATSSPVSTEAEAAAPNVASAEINLPQLPQANQQYLMQQFNDPLSGLQNAAVGQANPMMAAFAQQQLLPQGVNNMANLLGQQNGLATLSSLGNFNALGGNNFGGNLGASLGGPSFSANPSSLQAPLPQSDSSALSRAYQQLLNQSNQPSLSRFISTPTSGMNDPNRNNASMMNLGGNSSSNIIGAPQAPQILSTAYQQFLTQQSQQSQQSIQPQPQAFQNQNSQDNQDNVWPTN